MLATIFNYLEPRDQIQCILVNSHWNYVMQRVVNRNLQFKWSRNNQHYYLLGEPRLFDVFKKSARVIHNLKVPIYALPDFDPQEDESEKLTDFQKIGQNVRVLQISDFMYAEKTKTLKVFPVLEELILDEPSAIESLREISQTVVKLHFQKVPLRAKQTTVDSIMALSNLKIITGNKVNLNYMDERLPNCLKVPTEIIKFKKKYKKYLNSCESYNLYSSNCSVALESHVNLLHKNTLDWEDLEISLGIYHETLLFSGILDFLKNIRVATIFCPATVFHDDCWFAHNMKLRWPNLETLLFKEEKLRYGELSKCSRCKKCLKAFIKNTPKLVKIELEINAVEHFVPIFEYEKKLTHLRVIAKENPVSFFFNLLSIKF